MAPVKTLARRGNPCSTEMEKLPYSLSHKLRLRSVPFLPPSPALDTILPESFATVIKHFGHTQLRWPPLCPLPGGAARASGARLGSVWQGPHRLWVLSASGGAALNASQHQAASYSTPGVSCGGPIAPSFAACAQKSSTPNF